MRFQRQTLWVLVGLLALVTAGCDWPMYGFGPSHQGYNPKENKIGVANVASLTTQWTYPVTAGASPGPVAVSRGVAYVDDGNKLFAFEANGSGCSGDPKTCTPLWTATTGATEPSAPAVANGVVYVASDNGTLLAFDAKGTTNCSGTPTTCSPLWTASINTTFTLLTIPVVGNGKVFIGTTVGLTSTGGTVYAFDAAGTTNCSGTPKTCMPLWTATTQSGLIADVSVSRGVVYVPTGIPVHTGHITGHGIFYALDENTGAVLWTYSTHDLFWSTPAVANGVVYAPMTADVGSAVAQVAVFDATGSTNCSGTPKTCNPMWTAPTAAGDEMSDPAVENGVLYVSSGSSLYTFDAAGSTGCSGTPKTCAPLWTGTTNASGFVSLANGVAYVAAGGGNALAFDASGTTNCSGSPKTCKPIASISSDTFTAPVIANGVVYADNGSSVDALTVP